MVSIAKRKIPRIPVFHSRYGDENIVLMYCIKMIN